MIHQPLGAQAAARPVTLKLKRGNPSDEGHAESIIIRYEWTEFEKIEKDTDCDFRAPRKQKITD